MQRADSLVIETNLVPVASSAAAVTHAYVFRPNDLLFIEEAIVADIAASLTRSSPNRPPGGIARSPTSNPDAYFLLVKAEYYLAKRNNEAFVRAQGLIREALDLDPLYADAWAVLANTYQGFAWYGGMPADQAFKDAEAAARKAVALPPESAFGHAMLGATLSFYHYQWAAGEQEFLKAIKLDPENGLIRNWYALHLRSLGRFPEALAQARRAHDLDQLYRHYYWHIGNVLALAGRHEEAIVELRRALEFDSTYQRAREELAGVLASRARYDDALRELRTGFTIAGDTEKAQAVGAARGESGYRDALRRLARIEGKRLRVRARDGKYVAAFEYVKVLRDEGNLEGAITQLENAYNVRDPRVTYVRYAPEFRELANNPRVKALMRAMNLP